MSENEIVEPGNVDELEEGEVLEEIQVVEIPVCMRKGGKLIQMGAGILSQSDNETVIVVKMTTEEGKVFGDFLASKMVLGMSIGGIIDPELLKTLN